MATVRLPHDITADVGRIMASEPWRRSIRISDAGVPRDLTGTVWRAEVRAYPGATGPALLTGFVTLADQNDPDGRGVLAWGFDASATAAMVSGQWAELLCETWVQRWERFQIATDSPVARQP